MATSTFDKTFVVSKPEDQARLRAVLESDEPAIPRSVPPYTQADRDASAELLRVFFAKKDKEMANNG